jgi:hypothetical protein
MALAALLVLFLALAAPASACVGIAPSLDTPSLATPSFPKAGRAGDTALTITWSRVTGVDGYEVHRYNSAQRRYVKVATLHNGATAKWTDRRLKTGKKYVYRVRAYKNAGLAKEHSDFTYPVSAVPYKRDAKVVNAGAALKGAASMEIGVMQKQKVEASAVPSAYGTAKDRRVVDPTIRLLATNPIVSIEGGSIVGKSVGTTHIYALAHNGNVKRIRVDVVDYSKPATWENLDIAGEEAADILLNCKDEMTEVFSYLASCDRSKEIRIQLDSAGGIASDILIEDKKILGSLKALLAYSPLQCDIVANKWGVSMLLQGSSDYYVYYYQIDFEIQTDRTQEYIDQHSSRGAKIAPHWAVYYDFVAG